MFKVYIVNGQEYEVSNEKESKFLQEFPGAELIEDTISTPTETVTSTEVVPSSGMLPASTQQASGESAPTAAPITPAVRTEEGFWNELYQSVNQYWTAAGNTEETLDIAFGDVTEEDIEEYQKALIEEDAKGGPTQSMLDFYKSMEDNGGGLVGGFKAFLENPEVGLQQAVGSMAGLIRTGFDTIGGEKTAGAIATGAGVGASIGAGIGATGFVAGPWGVVTTGGGAIAGGTRGAYGALSGLMEGTGKISELMREHLKGDYSAENIKKVLNNDAVMSDIRSKAIGRGLTIAAVDGITGGLGKAVGTTTKATSGVAKVGKKLAQVGTEAVGGGVGEALAQQAAGEEYDAGAIVLEATAGPSTLPFEASLSAAQRLRKAKKDGATRLEDSPKKEIKDGPSSYRINGQPIKKEAFIETIDKMDPEDVKDADISVSNDPATNKYISDIVRNVYENEGKKKPKSGKKDKVEVEETAEEVVELGKEVQVGQEVDQKGRKITQFATTTEKDGIRTTKFEFNRSDKGDSQRNRTHVDPETAFGQKYEVNPEDQKEGFTVTKVSEVREGESGASADVRFTDKDGESFDGSVRLKQKKKTGGEVTEVTKEKVEEEVVPQRAAMFIPMVERDGETLVGKDAELEEKRIQAEGEKWKKEGRDPKTLQQKIQRRLALPTDKNDFLNDWIEGFVNGDITSTWAEFRRGPAKPSKTKLQKQIDKSLSSPTTMNLKARDKESKRIQPTFMDKAQDKYIKKIGDLQHQLEDVILEGAPPEIEETLREQIAYQEDLLRKSKNEVNKEVNLLNPNEKTELNELKSQQRLYQSFVNNEKAPDEVKKIAKEKLNEIENKQLKVFFGPSNRSIEASQKAQQIFENEGVEAYDKIIDTQEGLIRQIAIDKLNKVPKHKRIEGDLEALVSELKYGEEGAIGIIQNYDPAKNPSISSHLGQILKKRVHRAAKTVVPQLESKDFAAPEVANVIADETGITDPIIGPKVLADLLKLPTKLIDKARKAIPVALLNVKKALTTDKGKELSKKKRIALAEKSISDIIEGRVLNEIKTEFGKNTKTKKDFDNYLNKNWVPLTRAFLAQKSITKGEGVSKNWSMFPPSKQQVKDYFNGEDIIVGEISKKTGKAITAEQKSRAVADRKASLAEAVSKQFALELQEEYLEQNPGERKTLNKESNKDVAENNIIMFSANKAEQNNPSNPGAKNLTAQIRENRLNKVRSTLSPKIIIEGDPDGLRAQQVLAKILKESGADLTNTPDFSTAEGRKQVYDGLMLAAKRGLLSASTIKAAKLDAFGAMTKEGDPTQVLTTDEGYVKKNSDKWKKAFNERRLIEKYTRGGLFYSSKDPLLVKLLEVADENYIDRTADQIAEIDKELQLIDEYEANFNSNKTTKEKKKDLIKRKKDLEAWQKSDKQGYQVQMKDQLGLSQKDLKGKKGSVNPKKFKEIVKKHENAVKKNQQIVKNAILDVHRAFKNGASIQELKYLLIGMYQATRGAVKASYQFDSYETGAHAAWREEHSPPVNEFIGDLFKAIFAYDNEVDLSQRIDDMYADTNQFLISVEADNMINAAGFKMSSPMRIGSGASLSRLIKSFPDLFLNNIVDADGKSLAEKFDAPLDGLTPNPDLESKQLSVVEQNSQLTETMMAKAQENKFNSKEKIELTETETNKALLNEFGINIDELSTSEIIEKLNILRKAKSEASNTRNPTKKGRVFDFDDTLAKTKSKVLYTLPDGTKGSLDAAQFAKQYESLEEAGVIFDYSEFKKVKDGTKGPLANLAKRFTEALGDRDVFILTSRPAGAAAAIQKFLRSTLGVSIPLKNITGLENATPGAKAMWIAEKVSEGYNDIFFADDSKANVVAVEKMLTELGVTKRVQQVKFSKSQNLSAQEDKFNNKEKIELTETETTEAFLDIIQGNWNRDGSTNIEVFTDPAEMMDILINEFGQTELKAKEGVEHFGFKIGDKIFINLKAKNGLDTAVHESGHVWNSVVYKAAPKIWNGIISRVKDGALWNKYLAQVKSNKAYDDIVQQYEDGSDTFNLENEIFARILEDFGGKKIKSKGSTIKQIKGIIKEFFNELALALGFDPTTKNFGDLTLNEMIDLAVSEVVTGDPLANFSQLKDSKDKSWFRKTKANIDPSFKASIDPEYQGLKSLVENYRTNGRNLLQAIKDSYGQVKDIMSLEQWTDFVMKTVGEVQVGKTQADKGLVVAKKDALQNEKLRQNKIQLLKKAGIFKKGDENLTSIDLIKKLKEIDSEIRSKQKEQNKKEGLNKGFRKILNSVTGTWGKPSKWFVPPSAEDIKGLLYAFLPGGAVGVAAKKFFKSTLLDPYYKGVAAAEAEILQRTKQFSKLLKESGIDLTTNIKGTPYSIGQAIKVYNWVKQGVKVDVKKSEYIQSLVDAVENNPDLKAFADQIQNDFPISYTAEWRNDSFNKSIYQEINSGTRKKYLEVFSDNVDNIFDKDNLQEIENKYGRKFRQTLERNLNRMKTGKNRTSTDAQSNSFLNWVNRAVATTMFVNTRSATLQLLSSLNFIGQPNNNIFQATAALFSGSWKKDFNTLWNSDYLKARRSGAKFDVLADEISEGDVKGLNKLLKWGFLPTRMADSFAIALGGSALYRNTIKALMKDGMSEVDAKKVAMQKWIDSAEESQQSSDPSKISEIQSSSIGKVIYAFANTPFQYVRKQKRHLQDVVSGRSRAEGGMNQVRKDLQSVLYYSIGQAVLFNGLQTALFAVGFEDDEEKKEKLLDDKTTLAVERALTSYSKSLGNPGAVTGAIYSLMAEASEQIKKYGRIDNSYKLALEATSISPPLNAKLRDIVAIGNAYKYNTKQIQEDPLKPSLDNAVFEIAGNAASLGGVPLDRVLRKSQNLAAIANEESESWQKLFLLLGWSEWELASPAHEAEQSIKQKKIKKMQDSLLTPQQRRMRDYKQMSTEERKAYAIKRLSKGQPLFKKEKNVKILGKAHKDGTIEIAPGLSPEKKKKVQVHEEQHQRDMATGKLGYNNDWVKWSNKQYKRTPDKKVVYNGKKYIEGHPKLPWEIAANKAESTVS